jgi:hypothetical protein
MRIAGKRTGITRADLLDVAATFGIRDPAGVIERTRQAISRWGEHAAALSVPATTITHVESALAERWREVATG